MFTSHEACSLVLRQILHFPLESLASPSRFDPLSIVRLVASLTNPRLSQWGDIASIAGVFLTIAGFIVTIVGIWRSKSAAEAAKRAAEETRDSIGRYDAIADLSAAITIMDEIKRHQRTGAWEVLPDRYSELQRRLTAIKSAHVNLTEAQHQKLEGAIEAFSDLEKKINRAIVNKTPPTNPAKLNDIVSGQIDPVYVVLLSLQQTSRREE